MERFAENLVPHRPCVALRGARNRTVSLILRHRVTKFCRRPRMKGDKISPFLPPSIFGSELKGELGVTACERFPTSPPQPRR